MRREDSHKAASLIERAMNPKEAKYAQTAFERHFAMRDVGSHDGRYYFLAWNAGELVGITGLHHWAWGPEENVWLGWFAVEPLRQGTGLGTWMLSATEQEARELGFKKLFVETYDHPDFKGAIDFYRTKGFRHAGSIKWWLSDDESMVVMMKRL